MAKAKSRTKAKAWGDGFVFQKTRTRADGTTYTSPRWYLCYSVDGVKRREATDATTEAEAQKILDARVSAVQKGEIVLPSRHVRLSDLEQRYFEDYADKKRRSTATARGRWKNVAAHFDMDRRALSITTDELAGYARQRVKDGASDSTANRELAALKHAYRLALKARVLAHMPTFPERRPEPEPRQVVISPEQQAAIRAHLAAEEPAYGDVLDFSMMVAWRKAQVLSLEWSHVSEDEIRAPGAITKNTKSHVIPMTEALRTILARRRQARVVGSPWVFARRDGSRIRNFVKAWQSACVAAGTVGTRKGIIFHDSRRSGITNLSKAGVPEGVIMKISGHKTRDVFDRYNISGLADMKAALEAVSVPTTVPSRKGPQRVPKRRVVAMAGRRK